MDTVTTIIYNNVTRRIENVKSFDSNWKKKIKNIYIHTYYVLVYTIDNPKIRFVDVSNHLYSIARFV